MHLDDVEDYGSQQLPSFCKYIRLAPKWQIICATLVMNGNGWGHEVCVFGGLLLSVKGETDEISWAWHLNTPWMPSVENYFNWLGSSACSIRKLRRRNNGKRSPRIGMLNQTNATSGSANCSFCGWCTRDYFWESFCLAGRLEGWFEDIFWSQVWFPSKCSLPRWLYVTTCTFSTTGDGRCLFDMRCAHERLLPA